MKKHHRLALDGATAWIALLGVWAGLTAAGVYFRSVDLAIRHFKGRIIGHAVAFGVDPTLRVQAYVILCAVALGTAALVIIALRSVQAWSAARGQVLLGRREQRTVSLLALVGIGDLILSVLSATPTYRSGAEVLMLATALLSAGPLARLLTRRFERFPQMRPLGSPWTQGAILLLAYQLCVGTGILLELPLVLGQAALGRLLCIWLLLQAGVGMVLARDDAGATAGRAGVRLMRAGLPLLWLPVLGPLANELQYTLRTHVGWTPLGLARVMALGLVALALGLWFRVPPHYPSARTIPRLLRRWYFLAVLVSSALLTLHRQTITIDAVDAFHHGEMTTPIMQILQQGRIPYLEACLPHGLMDIVPQILFAAVNAPDRWDILIWGNGHWAGWLPVSAGMTLVYALLATVASPLSALLVVLFLPFELLFSCLNAPVVICVLALRVFLNNRGARRAWMLPASVLAIFLWRVDFGLAVLPAAVAVLVAVRWSDHRVRWFPVLLASGLMLAGTATLAAAISAWRALSLAEIAHNFVAYIGMQVQVGSYASVYNEMSPLVVLQYLLLPAVGLLVVLECGVRTVALRQSISTRAHTLMFMAVISLVLFVRSLQRHSLFEGLFSPYLFLFLLAALPLLMRPARRAWVAPLLIVVVVAAAFLLPDIRTLPRDVRWPALVGEPARYAFRTWSAADQRVLVNDPQTDDVVRLLRAELKPGQTFYAFANAPLLYFLTGTVPPTYILETTYHVSDDVQRTVIRELDSLRRADRLPLVVFKQNTGFDTVDGIPNEIRSYRIVEYIYAHYVPWANAGRYELWIDKTLATAPLPLGTGLEGAVVARYPLPLHAPTASANMSVHTGDAGSLVLAATGEPAWVEGLFVPPSDVVWGTQLEFYLTLHCATTAKGILQATFSFEGQAGRTSNVSEVVVAPTDDDRAVDVSLPLRLGDEQPPALTGIRLLLPQAATLTLHSAELEIRRRSGGTAWAWSPVGAPYPQHFELFRLSEVWANFDDHDPVHTCRELRTLQSGGPVEVAPGRDLLVPVQPASMQTGQYLHLRLQADRAAVLTVAYGAPTRPNTFALMIPATAEPRDYLVRISTQWEWYRGTANSLRLSSTGAVQLSALRLLAGD